MNGAPARHQAWILWRHLFQIMAFDKRSHESTFQRLWFLSIQMCYWGIFQVLVTHCGLQYDWARSLCLAASKDHWQRHHCHCVRRKHHWSWKPPLCSCPRHWCWSLCLFSRSQAYHLSLRVSLPPSHEIEDWATSKCLPSVQILRSTSHLAAH